MMEGKITEPNHVAKLTASLLKAPPLNKHLCRQDGNFQAIFYAWVKVFSALSSKKKNWGFIWIYSSLKYRIEIWGREKKSSERGVKITLGSKKHIIMKKSEWTLCASCRTSFLLSLLVPISMACGHSKLHLLPLEAQKAQELDSSSIRPRGD